MKKNILIFCHSPATQFIDICNQYHSLFDSNQFTVTVAYLTGKDTPEIRKRTTADEVIFFDFSAQVTRGLKLRAIISILKLCRHKKFDTVICHRFKPIYVMLWVAQFVSFRALFFVMHELDTMKNISRKFLIAVLKRKNMIFAGVSNAVREDLRKSLWHFPHDKIITLHNMIDITTSESKMLSKDAARKFLNIPDNVFLFGSIGRLVPNKDHATLIQAFAKIKPSCPNAKLMIIGDGVLENSLKNLIQSLHLDNDCIFTGFIPNAYQYLRAFDFYISSSTQEAFGRVLLEAMVAKVPIIATAVNGVPEVIGDAGTLIPPSNIHLLGQQLQSAYELSLTQKNIWVNKGYERVHQFFSFEKFHEIFWRISFS